jgi:hypothetical protein
MAMTAAQRKQADAMLAGTFDRLDTTPKMQPAYTTQQVYGGIIPPKGSSDWNNMNAALHPVPAPLKSNPVKTMQVDAMGNPALNAIKTATLPGMNVPPKDNSRLPTTSAIGYGPQLDQLLGMSPATAPQGGSAFNGGWGSTGFGQNLFAPPFLSGDPGTVDWGAVNPDPPGIGLGSLLGGDPTYPAAQPQGGLSSLMPQAAGPKPLPPGYRASANNIYGNPTKYGATSAERQASAAKRDALTAQYNQKSSAYFRRRAEKRAGNQAGE